MGSLKNTLQLLQRWYQSSHWLSRLAFGIAVLGGLVGLGGLMLSNSNDQASNDPNAYKTALTVVTESAAPMELRKTFSTQAALLAKQEVIKIGRAHV